MPGDDDGPSAEAILRAHKRIQVRHFAGPVQYTEHLTHLRVAHLTDLHVGRVTPWAIQLAAVDLTNQAKPDLVLLTGDFVCHSQAYLDRLEHLITRFEAPVMAVLASALAMARRLLLSTPLTPARPKSFSAGAAVNGPLLSA